MMYGNLLYFVHEIVVWMNVVKCASWPTVNMWIVLIETLTETCPFMLWYYLFENFEYYYELSFSFMIVRFFITFFLFLLLKFFLSCLHLNIGINSCVYCTYQYLWMSVLLSMLSCKCVLSRPERAFKKNICPLGTFALSRYCFKVEKRRGRIQTPQNIEKTKQKSWLGLIYFTDLNL